MRRFLLISSCFLLIYCGLPTLKNLEESQVKTTLKSIENPYFKDLNTYVFKSAISIYNKDLSGILVLKKENENVTRLAFTTEFGNTLLDMTITPTGFKKHFAITNLDKKIILKTLAKDIRTLTSNGLKVEKAFRQAEKNIYLTTLNDYLLFYYFNNKQLEKIIKATKNKEKLKILFSIDEEEQLKLITLAHQNIQLNIKLTPIY